MDPTNQREIEIKRESGITQKTTQLIDREDVSSRVDRHKAEPLRGHIWSRVRGTRRKETLRRKEMSNNC